MDLQDVADDERAAALGCALVLGSLPAGAQTPSTASPRIEALLQKMTLEEKIGQLVQRAGGRSKALNSRLDAAELDRVRAGQVGSYLHVAGAEPLAKLQKVALEESRLGIPLLFAMDVVHGYRTCFPCSMLLHPLMQIGRAAGDELNDNIRLRASIEH